jgi:predicted O-methyltransferase YrrM
MNDRQTWTPKNLLSTASSCWEAITLQTAVKLDVFSCIAGGAARPDDLSRELGADARAVAMLCNALAAMGLLEKQGGLFQNAEPARRYLVKSSPEYIGYIITHFYHTVASWWRLPQAIRTGSQVSSVYEKTEDERESFLMGMHNLASALAPRIAAIVDLAGAGSLLDLGGGPGTYAINFCLKNPGLQACVFDLRESGQYARRTIALAGLSDRVSFIPGNYDTQDIPGTYDAVWLSQILHAEGPADCQKLISKAAAALNPGGAIYIHDFILNDDLAGPAFPAVFSLNMLVATKGGQSYSEAQLRHMLEQAGVQHIQRLDFTGPNDSGIICGRAA